jgi:PhzF family phenazine biosynthesis protein
MPDLLHVDAFADRAFAGNPAGVCLLDRPAADAWMQAVAGELNLPATAYVWPVAAGFGLRWFSAAAELTLCGHGTLAAAHVLLERGKAPDGEAIRFDTRAGLLQAFQRNDRIELILPGERSTPADLPADLERAIGQAPLAVERNRLDYLVELASGEAVRAARPDLGLLRQVPTRGLILTARSDEPGVDFVSRFFAPSVGIDEDAVTGSAHCCLGPYWQPRLGKGSLVGRQLSVRGGLVHVEVDGARVRLGGRAVTVLRGTIDL